MPVFPNIEDLREKLQITGNEEIQISATQKIKLQALIDAALLSTLTGLTPSSNVNDEDISSADTILEAVTKLLSRTGNNDYRVYAIKRSLGDDPSGVLIRAYSDESNKYLNTVIEYDSVVGLTIAQKYTETSETVNKSPNQVANLVLANPSNERVLNIDKLSYLSSNEVTVSAGDVIKLNTIPSSIILNPDNFTNALNKSAILLTTGNLTMSLFTQPVGANNILMFSQDFNEQPYNAAYQVVTIQLAKIDNAQYAFIINKAGYWTN